MTLPNDPVCTEPVFVEMIVRDKRKSCTLSYIQAYVFLNTLALSQKNETHILTEKIFILLLSKIKTFAEVLLSFLLIIV